MSNTFASEQGRKITRYGILLLLLGLLTGLAIPALENPRMGLSSHLEGTLNGILLIALGSIWPTLRLSQNLHRWAFGLALFGTFTNWATTLLAAAWGAGGAMMPFAGEGHHGTGLQEGIITFGLGALSVAMIAVCGILLWGIRGKMGNFMDQ